MKEKIIEMLGNGIPPSMIATAVGCDPSYVSQLMADDSIRERVSVERVKDLDNAVKADAIMDDIELQSLERMKQLLPFISRPLDAARIFQTVNMAKRKTAEVTGLQTPTAPLVQINITHQAAVQFRLSADQQVVEVDGRSMTTLPAKLLNEKLREREIARPALSDATTARQLLENIVTGIPEDTIANVL